MCLKRPGKKEGMETVLIEGGMNPHDTLIIMENQPGGTTHL